MFQLTFIPDADFTPPLFPSPSQETVSPPPSPPTPPSPCPSSPPSPPTPPFPVDHESSLEDPSVGDDPSSDDEVRPDQTTYQVVAGDSKRGGSKLFSRLGFSFNVKRRLANTHWQCTVRPKSSTCPATVIERSGEFNPSHNHPPEAGLAAAATIKSKVKERAVADLFKPASAIVDEVSGCWFILLAPL